MICLFKYLLTLHLRNNYNIYMKHILFLISLVFFSVSMFSQQNRSDENSPDTIIVYKFCYRYSVDEASLNSIDVDELGNHPLGDNIARKLYLLRETYTVIEKPTPTSPGEKTIIFKPSIYNSLQKLNRYYKKQVKAELITEEEARKKLNTYLDIAISVFIENTESFEDELRRAKGPDEISEVFSMVELK
jgi:hypothetical protein